MKYKIMAWIVVGVVFSGGLAVWTFEAKQKAAKEERMRALCLSDDYWMTLQERFEMQPIQEGEILGLGDSITEGIGNRFPFQGLRFINRGIPGDTLQAVGLRIDRLRVNPDSVRYVSLMMGINDLLNCRRDVDMVLQAHEAVIQKLLKLFPKATIIVNELLPIAAETPLALSQIPRPFSEALPLILKMNERLKERYATTSRVVVLELNSHFRLGQGTSLDWSLSTDGLHLNDKGYALWFDRLNKLIATMEAK